MSTDVDSTDETITDLEIVHKALVYGTARPEDFAALHRLAADVAQRDRYVEALLWLVFEAGATGRDAVKAALAATVPPLDRSDATGVDSRA